MKRGEVYNARLNPIEGSEQAGGDRPVIIVSRDAINETSSVVLVVPCTTYQSGRRLYPSHVLLPAPEGGLELDSVALAERVLTMDKRRLGRFRGTLSDRALREVNQALLIALDLA